MMMAIAVKKRAMHRREWGRNVERDAWEGAGGERERASGERDARVREGKQHNSVGKALTSPPISGGE
jgi:hypothetical protein